MHNHVLNAINSYRAFLPLLGLNQDKLKTPKLHYPERHQLFHIPKAESQVYRIKSGRNESKQMTIFTVLFIIVHIYCFFRASSAKPVMILQPKFTRHLFQCSRIVHSLLATNTAAPGVPDFRNLIFQTETYPRSQPEIPDLSVCSQTLTLENVTIKATGNGNVLEMIYGKQSHTDLEINLVWEV